MPTISTTDDGGMTEMSTTTTQRRTILPSVDLKRQYDEVHGWTCAAMLTREQAIQLIMDLMRDHDITANEMWWDTIAYSEI